MSKMDPFTQKLLERTQARKQLRNQQLASTAPRSPLKETINSNKDSLEVKDKSISKKRQSSEGINASFEKKSKHEDEVENAFAHRQGMHSEYVVPSTAMRSPTKSSAASSLKSRLAHLNHNYEEMYEIDHAEIQRKDEMEKTRKEREMQHKKQIELERTQRIQERIFGKNNVPVAVSNKEEGKPKPSLVKVTATTQQSVQSPLKKTVDKQQSVEKSNVKKETVREKQSINTKSSKLTNETASRTSREVATTKAHKETKFYNENKVDENKEKKFEERSNQIKLARKLAEEEEKLNSASVGDKKSIFEQKMKEERAAREKEIETEKRLRQKTTRKPESSKNLEEPMEVDEQTKVSKTNEVKASDNVRVKASDNVRSIDSPKKKTGMMKHVVTTPSKTKHVERKVEEEKSSTRDNIKHKATEKARKEVKLASPQQGEITAIMNGINNDLNDFESRPSPTKSTKTQKKHDKEIPKPVLSLTPSYHLEETRNFTGDINSPQPIDCTEDTGVSDSNAFDISSILRAAEHEDTITSPQKVNTCTDKTPMRSSTMKVLNQQGPVMTKPVMEFDLTPVQMDEVEDEGTMSEFQKQIRSKRKTIKTTIQQKKLKEMDAKGSSPQQQEKPVKPPRTRGHSVHATNVPPSYDEYISKKATKEQIVPIETDTPVKTTNINTNLKQDDKCLSLKPMQNQSRKKLRRSHSFTEGQSPQPVKSGYNKHSDRYNAHSSSFDKPDIVYSKRDQIQNLLEEAACQQNIVLQTSQALNVAEGGNEDKSGSPEVIEGERLLLLATEKRTVCLAEVRDLKETDSVQFLNTLDTIQPCTATLGLTEVKLPLHHDFVSALRQGRMDLGVFHFVIIVSCGSKHVYSTKVVSTYDQIDGHSLVMNSNIFLRNIAHDFTLTVRVFGLHTRKQNDQTARLKKNHTSNQSSPGNLKNLFSKRNKDEEYISHASPQTVFRTSNFKLVGETKINLSILGSGGKHVLTKVPSNCPLEGFLQVRVGCKPEFTANANGFLTILEDVGGYTTWNRRWCTLKDSKVLSWRYPDDEETKEPLSSIDLRHCTTKVIGLLSRDKCARPHTFELCVKRPMTSNDEENLITTIEGKNVIIKFWICGDNKEDRIIWMDAINRQLNDSRAWILKKVASTSKSSTNNNNIVCNENGKAVAV